MDANALVRNNLNNVGVVPTSEGGGGGAGAAVDVAVLAPRHHRAGFDAAAARLGHRVGRLFRGTRDASI
jgi:hypothetical protein